MSWFLHRSLRFALPVLMLLALVEFALRRIPNNYAYIDDQLLDHGDSVEVLILGNSHAYNGVDPTQLGYRGFNAAHPSQDHRLDHLLLKRYIDHLPHLKAIVLSTSYASIGKQMDQDKESWRLKNYVIYMGQYGQGRAAKDHLELLNGRASDLLRSIHGNWFHGRNNLTVQPWGGVLGKTRDNVDFELDGIKAADRHHARSPLTFATSLKELEAIVRIAKQHRTPVLTFAPPGHSLYRRHLHATQLALSQRIPRGLASPSDRIMYVDLLADPRFDTDDFSDADHLNAAGNRKLTSIIASKLDSILRQ